MERLEKFMDKYLGPVANYMSNSPFFSALTDAFIKTTPITLGVSVLMIIGNFPWPGWIDWLREIGLYQHFVAAQGATIHFIGIFVVFNFAYAYTKKTSEYNAQIAGLIAIASFLILIPQEYVLYTVNGNIGTEFPVDAVITGMNEMKAFDQVFTGGEGLLVAILVGFFVSKLYKYLNDKNFVIKLPETVPTNVAESLRPTLLTGAIFMVMFGIRLLFVYAPFLAEYGNLFTFIGSVLQKPLMGLVANPAFLIIILTLANVFWFFGIHPQVVYSIVTPMIISISYANIIAFTNQEPLPYLATAVIGLALGTGFGGQGSTIGLVVSMSRAKSTRYKEMFKLSAIPSIFNINEPLIFGMPIILNPYFFIPMLLGPVLMGAVGYGVSRLVTINLNPTISLPWTTPAIIKAFVQGGVPYLIVAIAAFLTSILIWYPFFKIADKKEYEIEHGLIEE